jgi:group I intron endonuclease
MRTGIIYKATNKINGKVYIGQTVKTFEKRKNRHRTDSKLPKYSSYKFYRAINKYGWDAFTWCILLECPADDLNEQEILHIEACNSFHTGYNSNIGGSGHRGFTMSEETKQKLRVANIGKKKSPEACMRLSQSLKGHTTSAATRAKIGDAHRGTKHTKEAKEKMSKSRCGENNHWFGTHGSMYGRHHTEETKRKISESNKGKVVSEETRKKMSSHIVTEETRKKLRNKVVSKETRAKLSESNQRRITKMKENGEQHPLLGIHRSEETKAKMRIASKERMAKEREANGGTNPRKGKPRSEEIKQKLREAAQKRCSTEEGKNKMIELVRNREKKKRESKLKAQQTIVSETIDLPIQSQTTAQTSETTSNTNPEAPTSTQTVLS